MRIDVVGKHMAVTDAIRQYAEAKSGKLVKFFDGTQQISVVLEELKHGEFQVELVVDVTGHDDFIAVAKAQGLYAAMDLAVDKASRQLTDFKERLKQGKR